MDLMSMVFTFAIILLISSWKGTMARRRSTKQKDSVPTCGNLNISSSRPYTRIPNIISSRQEIRILAENDESEGELLNQFFNYCAREGVKPVKVEFGCLYIKNDKLKKGRAVRLLKGEIEKGGGQK